MAKQAATVTYRATLPQADMNPPSATSARKPTEFSAANPAAACKLVEQVREKLRHQKRAYGGVRAMADALAIPRSTVSWWTTENVLVDRPLQTQGNQTQRPKNRRLASKSMQALLASPKLPDDVRRLLHELDMQGDALR